MNHPTPPSEADLKVDAAAWLARVEHAEGNYARTGKAEYSERLVDTHQLAAVLRRLVAAEAERDKLRKALDLLNGKAVGLLVINDELTALKEAHVALVERCEAWKELAKAWADKAEEVERPNTRPYCSKWFGAMTDEEKIEFRRRGHVANTLRECANELRRRLGEDA